MFSHLDIVSTEFLVTFGVAVLAAWAGVGWLVRRLHRDHRLARRWWVPALSGLVALSLSVGMAADCVNAYYDYLPTVDDLTSAVGGDRQWPQLSAVEHVSPVLAARKYPHGVTVHMPLATDSINGFGRTEAIAYLPPQYFTEPTARFATVYLFHGSPGKPSDWFHGGRAGQTGTKTALAGLPTIIVAPQMSRQWTDDPECVDGQHEKVESHLISRVLPYVDSTLRTQADRDHRVFAGMSAGGYCALNLGLRNRSLVSTVIDLSGLAEPTHDKGMSYLFGGDREHQQECAHANSPARYTATLPPEPAMRLWLDVGSADHEVMHAMAQLVPVLRARGFAVEWRVRSGSHTYDVWKPAFAEALPWALGGPPGAVKTNASKPGPG